ncbi:SRPBCC domain-containing protein [Streptodolium elevatio]|uniref:SRPBCC domain-containing protein n=1 Tax=Streptodolium elevatio TaxID=3157996 RepID=A0ABV3DD79_9ACTN
MAYTTEVSRHIKAARPAVYRALLDPEAVARWRVPDDMRSHVHEFEPREGGRFRVSLTYEAPDGVGKTSAHTDTYHGRFTRLVPDELVAEELEFETDDPTLQGTMTLTTTLTDVPGGTEVRILHEGIPDTIPRADNEQGTQMSLTALAALLESP